MALFCLLCLLLAGEASPARAQNQNPRTAAEQYIARVMLSQGEVLGYRVTSATTLDVAASGGLAGRRIVLEADPPNTWRGNNRINLEMVVYTSADAAQQRQTALEAQFRTWLGPANCSPATPLLNPDGVDASIVCDYQPPGFPDIAWRRGQVHFWLSLQNRIPGGSANAEAFRLANQQNDKAAGAGPFMVASAAPTPPSSAPPTPEQPKMPDMLLLLTARTGGVMARDGTIIRAFIGNRECGRATLTLGFTALRVASHDTNVGCGTPGATVTFRIDDDPANESVTWGLDNFATPVSLTATRAVIGGGLVVRPVLVANCVSPSGSCSEHERALWSGNLDAWLEELAALGVEPSADTLLRAWVTYRAERGEVFGNLARAYLDAEPFTFILAVRYVPVGSDPYTYVSLFNFGADREVGGWTIRAGNAQYTFPEGAVLANGTCRVYSSAPPADDSGSTCPGATFSGGEGLGPNGFVEVLSADGQVVDAVAW